MLNIIQLKGKNIIDSETMIKIYDHYLSKKNDEIAIAELRNVLEDYLNEYLRGMEFTVRKSVKETLIEQCLEGKFTNGVNYYDAAIALIALPLSSKQMITNLQSWILMSTEFSLTAEETIRTVIEAEIPVEPSVRDEWVHFLDNEDTELSNEQVNEPTVNMENLLLDHDNLEQALLEHDNLTSDDSMDSNSEEIGTEKSPVIRIVVRVAVALTLLCTILIVYKALPRDEHKPVSLIEASALVKGAVPAPPALRRFVSEVYDVNQAGYPAFLQYEVVDLERLKGYLKRKNSMLSEEPYFQAILESAAQNDVNPIILFAITGQEQNFVKIGSENAALIVNNPFNVYHSWSEYNTDIHDAADVAAKTIRVILNDRESGVDPFMHLNKIYAEDPKWHMGVSFFFEEIQEHLDGSNQE